MSEVNSKPNISDVEYYLPHHGVLNEKNQTTKLRVVFDASCQTSAGVSFNDLQYIGPKVQEDLISILLRFRQHQVAFCADIIKMYRQILVQPSQRSLQKILWRSESTEEIKVFQLNTVTYGTASAPWLAVRCLKELALENSEEFPEASKLVLSDFYMDDILTGCDSVQKAKQLCDEIQTILASGCFLLQKWTSNSPDILQHVQTKNPIALLKLGDDEGTKTLGLYWNCENDTLHYSINIPKENQVITKRSVLSDVSKIFDPLGLLIACTIVGKIMLQQLWMTKLTWDESLPSELHTKWCKFRQELSHLSDCQIPRLVLCSNPILIEVHEFCDSSLEAYGASLYLRSVNQTGKIIVSLLCAKSRVAPLKSLTIPRLELCSAHLLSQLVDLVRRSLSLPINKYFFWSDSSVTLCRVKTQPNLLQSFVQNRVSQIQSLTDPNEWRHVKTRDNPADLLSRGVSPKTLATCTLWWSGPNWLSQPEENWHTSIFKPPDNIPELRKQKISLLVAETIEPFSFKKFSKFNMLRRTMAYVQRFIHNCKCKPSDRRYNVLTALELQQSLLTLLKISQTSCFSEELQCLLKGKSLPKKSQILNLNPFLDSEKIIRVGGQIQASSFEFDKKHPILLSDKHPLTKLIFQYEHSRLFHAGPQLLLSSIRNRYWPISGRNIAKRTVYSWVDCFRVKPTQNNPIMENLPKPRVSPAPPFNVTGIDYAGPVNIKDRKGRGAKIWKSYICLFICLSTKAIHLELVSDLSTEAFIVTFRRFCARRGKPSQVFSDNGSNFVGARTELNELAKFLLTQENSLQETLNDLGTSWNFIPAYSPHFGGLWEAGVRSTKGHLKRVMNNVTLTYEELSTPLAEIEAILNSRPLTPLSCDPSDYSALTPSHFLIGQPLTALPDPDLQAIPINRLSRYQLIQQMQQHFWRRWSQEFISELQIRTRWKTNHGKLLKLGTLVLVKEDNLPPLKWKLGKITELHPGDDGVVRVATLQTTNGLIKRSWAKIVVLPID